MKEFVPGVETELHSIKESGILLSVGDKIFSMKLNADFACFQRAEKQIMHIAPFNQLPNHDCVLRPFLFLTKF